MRHLMITLYVAGLQLENDLQQRIQSTFTRTVRHDGDGEDGSVTIETVAWAVGIIAIVAIAVAAVRSYVHTQAARLS